jgi:hypothetical protein
MKVFTTTTFTGHYPIGVCAVLVAENKAEAIKLLESELSARDLRQTIDPEWVLEVDMSRANLDTLNDGEY